MGTVRALVVTTVCRSVGELVERYHGRVEGRSIFVGGIEERVIGAGEVAFALLLADRRPVLAGVCEVIEVFRDTHNEFGRRGMRIGIARLGPQSEQVWTELVARSSRRFPRGSSIEKNIVDLTADAVPIEIHDDDQASALSGPAPG